MLEAEDNEKLSLDQKYNYFIVSAFSVLVIHLLSWGAVLLSKLIDLKSHKPGTWRYTLHSVLYLTTPIVATVFTASEASLLLFYQFQNFYFDTTLDALSSIVAILFAGYFYGFCLWVVWQINKSHVEGS